MKNERHRSNLFCHVDAGGDVVDDPVHTLDEFVTGDRAASLKRAMSELNGIVSVWV